MNLEELKAELRQKIEVAKTDLANNSIFYPDKENVKKSRLQMFKNFLAELEALDAPVVQEKVEVQQCVADWFEANKEQFDYNVFDYCNNWIEHDVDDKFRKWFNNLNNNPIQTLTKMTLYGYTVEKEKEPLYYVKLIESNQCSYLNLHIRTGNLLIAGDSEDNSFKTKFTRDEIFRFKPEYWSFTVPVEEEF